MLKVTDLAVSYGAIEAIHGDSWKFMTEKSFPSSGQRSRKDHHLKNYFRVKKADKGEINFDGADLIKTEPSKIINLKANMCRKGGIFLPR